MQRYMNQKEIPAGDLSQELWGANVSNELVIQKMTILNEKTGKSYEIDCSKLYDAKAHLKAGGKFIQTTLLTQPYLT